MYLRRYLFTLLSALLLLGGAASFLPFAKHSHVQPGTTVEDVFHGRLQVPISKPAFEKARIYVEQVMAGERAFAGKGAVTVVSSRLEVTDTTFEHGGIGGPFVRCTAHVQWSVPPGAAAGSQGWIVDAPGLSPVPAMPIEFESRASEIRMGTRAFREVNIHGNSAAMLAGRLLFGIAAVLPFVLAVHSIWWMRFIRSEKRARVPALLPASPPQLPATLHANPVAEWQGYIFIFLVFNILGVLVQLLALFNGYIEYSKVRGVFGVQGAGLLLALGLFWFLGRAMVTLKVDATQLCYLRGRSGQWLTSAWADLRAVQLRVFIRNGIRTEAVEIEFPDGKRRAIYHNAVLDFPTARDLLLAMFEKSRAGQASTSSPRTLGDSQA